MPASLPIHVFKRTALTGGAAGSLDGIDGNELAEGYRCEVEVSGLIYKYWLNATSGAAESSPNIISPDTNSGNKRRILAGIYIPAGSTIALGSDADGDMYYRASSVLTRLAKGAANTKLFINDGATAPVWASGLKIGSFSRDMAAASGDVGYTGVGFKPSLILFFGNIYSAMTFFIGVGDGSSKYSVSYYTNNATVLGSATCLLYVDGSNYQSALIKTMDADGFTLTWTKTASPTGNANVVYVAIR